MDNSYISMPKGFKASGICADLKGEGKLDFALVYSEYPATVSGVYTSNLVKGHSLQRSIKLIANGNSKRAIAINAKNANACVGPIGEEDANDIAKAIAEKLNVSSDEVLTASTGVIGIRLPVEKMVSHVPNLVSSLGSDEQSAHNAELAMMTTDTVPKEVSAKITLQDGREVTVAAMAKGSGMIHPNLATMICVFTTDAKIDKTLLDDMLKRAVSHTFNRVSVDGDTSVCDSVMVFANGASEVEITEGTEDADIFYTTLEQLSTDLARMIACDGEGATKLLEVIVNGAKDANDARIIATQRASSSQHITAHEYLCLVSQNLSDGRSHHRAFLCCATCAIKEHIRHYLLGRKQRKQFLPQEFHDFLLILLKRIDALSHQQFMVLPIGQAPCRFRRSAICNECHHSPSENSLIRCSSLILQMRSVLSFSATI